MKTFFLALRAIGSRMFSLSVVLAVSTSASLGCHSSPTGFLQTRPNVEPLNYQISLGVNQYQIAGYIARSTEAGRLPALLVLNGDEGSAEKCIDSSARIVAMGIQVACVSIPGYGRSSGPSRFVGPQAVLAARRALDLLEKRPEVDANRVAVWGAGDGALAAGLLMDYDSRPRALILQSGAYDLLKLWPHAPLRTKLSIIHQVWPSKRILRGSVIRAPRIGWIAAC